MSLWGAHFIELYTLLVFHGNMSRPYGFVPYFNQPSVNSYTPKSIDLVRGKESCFFAPKSSCINKLTSI